VALRWNGSRWQSWPLPPHLTGFISDASAPSADDIWAVSYAGGYALHWNGHHWAVVRHWRERGALTGVTALSARDVWVFGTTAAGLHGMGTWHFNGRTWTHIPGEGGLNGGSALSAGSIWAFGGTHVAHWNGRAWSAISVAGLLPARDKQGLNDPAVTAIYAQSPTSVWAVGNGNREDEGGPLVVLHFNGHAWSRVAENQSFVGDGVTGQAAPDGRGGLWIPLPGIEGGASHLVHYSGGQLTAAVLPVAANRIDVESVAWIPGTFQALAGGFTHAANSAGTGDVAVILQFER
jgi:hypothetical protein